MFAKGFRDKASKWAKENILPGTQETSQHVQQPDSSTTGVKQSVMSEQKQHEGFRLGRNFKAPDHLHFQVSDMLLLTVKYVGVPLALRNPKVSKVE